MRKNSIVVFLSILFLFSSCSSGGDSSPEVSKPVPEKSLYSFKFKINSDGGTVAQIKRVGKTLPKNFKLTNEILAEQNITLYISEIGFNESKLKLELNLTKGIDEKGDTFFYIQEYIKGGDGNDSVDFKKGLKFRATFNLNGNEEEVFEATAIMLNMLDNNGNLNNNVVTFNMKRLNIQNNFDISRVHQVIDKNGFNRTSIDIDFSNEFHDRGIKSLDEMPNYIIKATNDNARILLPYFDKYIADSDSLVGKISDLESIQNKNRKLSIRLNLDRESIKEWVDGRSSFTIQIENLTHHFDLDINGQNLVCKMQFVPYIEDFYDETFEYKKDFHHITVEANDPDGENEDLNYTFSSKSFLIDQNGSSEAILTGDMGVVTVYVTDKQGNDSEIVNLNIGSFTGIKSCINSQLGLADGKDPSETQLAELIELFCQNSDIDSLSGIEKLVNLEILDISGNSIVDLTPLKELSNLEVLELQNNLIYDISALVDLPKLKSLNIGNNDIQKIIALPSKLENLNIDNNKIVTLEFLKDMVDFLVEINKNNDGNSSIGGISIGGNYIEDIEKTKQLFAKLGENFTGVVLDFDTMKKFPIFDNPFTNFIHDKLGLAYDVKLKQADYNKITELKLENEITEIDGIERLINLKNLNFENSRVKDFSKVSEVKSLKTLVFYNNRYLELLPENPNLATLHIYGLNSPLKDISSISKMTKLTNLRIYNSENISKLPDMKNLQSLNSIYLQSNKISDISGLKDIVSLVTVRFDANPISEISSLKKSTGIQTLHLSNLNISSAEPLKVLKKITDLHLFNLQLTDLTSISEILNLRTLDLGHTNIADLNFLTKSHTKLEYLYIYSNDKLSDTLGISKLPNLKTLEIKNNKHLESVENLDGLETLLIQDNNLTTIRNLSNIVRVEIFKNNFTTFENVGNITQLYISGNNLETIQNLKDIENLQIGVYRKWNLLYKDNSYYKYSTYIHGNSLVTIQKLSDIQNILITENTLTSIENLKDIQSLRISSILYQHYNYSTYMKYFKGNSLETISDLSNISSLEIYDNVGLKSFPDLNNSKEITSLNFSNTQDITNIPSLDSLNNLTSLEISNLPNIETIPSLDNLTNLENLTISYLSEIEAIPSFDSLTNLTNLTISDNAKLADITLNNLDNLTSLTISNLPNMEILPSFDSLTNLTNLTISTNGKLAKISLDNLDKLKYLGILNNGKLAKITIADTMNLTDLKIKSNHSLRNITDIGNAQILTISDNNNLTDISINKASNLKTLVIINENNISDINISDISKYWNLHNLRDVTINNLPKLSNISIIKDWNLTSLYLYNLNNITDFTPLESLLKLRNLTIQNTNLVKLPSLEKSKDYLYNVRLISNHSLNDVSSISELGEKMNYLYIYNNKNLVKAPNVSKLVNLRYLDLYSNSIADISELESISNKLYVLDLRYNPITNFDIARLKETLTDKNIYPNYFYVSYNNIPTKFLNLEQNFVKDTDTVKDEVTGLIWEDQSEVFEGNFSEVTKYCKDLELDDISTWRVPTNKELWYLADRTKSEPTISSVFQNTESGNFEWNEQSLFETNTSDETAKTENTDWYMTNQSVTYAGQDEYNWVVGFYNGTDGWTDRKGDNFVRCVAGESRYENINFSRNGDEVTDNTHKLIWKDIDNDVNRTFNQAKSYCEDLGDDWRLPSVEELYSITDQKTKGSPAVNSKFENIESYNFYWSNTVNSQDSDSQGVVSFGHGFDYFIDSDEVGFTICIRNK